MIYGYTRVSSKGQITNDSLGQQKKEIEDRYENVTIAEEQYTATTTDRPVLNGFIEKLQCNDILVVTKLDRLARSTVEGIELIQSLFAKGISVHVINLGVLENSSMERFFCLNSIVLIEVGDFFVLYLLLNDGRNKEMNEKSVEYISVITHDNNDTYLVEITEFGIFTEADTLQGAIEMVIP